VNHWIWTILPTALSGFVTGFLAWAGSIVFFRKRIPCVTVRLTGRWKRYADADYLYVLVAVTNIGLRKIVTTSCCLAARCCTRAIVGPPEECEVTPVPPVHGVLAAAGAGIWRPLPEDRGRIWTLDKGESNTYAFIVSLPHTDEPYDCFVQADYTCEPWLEHIPLIGFHSYTWRRDQLFDVDSASTQSLARHQDATDDRDRDTDDLQM
jgi:hypothetical protein